MHGFHPIAALTSAPGVGAVALIRVSGPSCHELLKPSLPGLSDRLQMRHAYYCQMKEGSKKLDDIVAIFFKGPHSFTGEDTVEINCHGGPFTVQAILKHLWSLGIQPAQPGEFSRRAFLNGKLDLVGAEGIAAVIEAQTEYQWRAAQSLKEGRLSGCIAKLRDVLIEAMAYLEARIDFPDEGDTADISLDLTSEKVRQVQKEVRELIATYRSGRVASQGMRVALIGPPNAGKSTLLNTLLGHNRAIVTDTPGTTRDYIEEKCLINGRLISVIDTAGIRDTNDKIESFGVEHAKTLAKEADVVLVIFGVDMDPTQASEILNSFDKKLSGQFIKVLSKIDLDHAGPTIGDDWVRISCSELRGLEDLKQRIADKFDQFVGSLNNTVFITSARHLELLQSAEVALQDYLQKAEEEFDECLAFELQTAARSLQEVLGEVHSEDILDRIFSTFCVGK